MLGHCFDVERETWGVVGFFPKGALPPACIVAQAFASLLSSPFKAKQTQDNPLFRMLQLRAQHPSETVAKHFVSKNTVFVPSRKSLLKFQRNSCIWNPRVSVSPAPSNK